MNGSYLRYFMIFQANKVIGYLDSVLAKKATFKRFGSKMTLATDTFGLIELAGAVDTLDKLVSCYTCNKKDKEMANGGVFKYF